MDKDNYLKKFDRVSLKTIKMVGKRAEKFHQKAFLVGGVVRDFLLKKTTSDLDVVVEGNAIELAKDLGKLLSVKPIIHKEFKTATLHLSETRHLDLATARKEEYIHPGALPSVEPSDLRDDLFRRDFTINALAISLNPNSFGWLLDIHNGLDDLKQKRIRVFHSQSFIDDPTRVLRAVRFEQRFDFKIETHTLKLLKEAIDEKLYKSVKAPRYFSEFKKILMEDDPTKTLKRLHQLGGLNFWGRSLKFDSRKLNPFHQNVCQLKRMPMLSDYQDWWCVYLMALLEEHTQGFSGDVLKQIQINKTFKKSILESRAFVKIFKILNESLKESEIYKVLEPFSLETLLYFRAAARLSNIATKIDRYLKISRNISLKIDGNDLKQLGVSKGVRVGRLLKEVLYQKMDKRLKTKTEEIKVAKKLIYS